MSTNLLIIEEVDHPPHADSPKKKSRPISSIIFFLFLLISAFSIRFHLPWFTGIRYVATCYQNVQQTIDSYPALRWTYSLIDPEFQKKQEAIQDILTVLEKHETGLAEVTRQQLAEVIYEESTRNNHDPKFILAFIAIESSFQNWSVSEAGAKGLMQIMPYVAESIAKDLGIEWKGDRTLFDPFLNIKMGVHYLSRLILDFKSRELAVTAYNYGPTYVKGLIDKKRKIPQEYYEKVAAMYQDLIASTKREQSPPTDKEDEQLTELPIQLSFPSFSSPRKDIATGMHTLWFASLIQTGRLQTSDIRLKAENGKILRKGKGFDVRPGCQQSNWHTWSIKKNFRRGKRG